MAFHHIKPGSFTFATEPIPEPNQATVPIGDKRHELPAGHRAVKRAVLVGLHREYSLVKEVA